MNERLRFGSVLAGGVFWGAVWGLYEATAGFLIHSVPRVPGLASIVLVPFAIFCLSRAVRVAGMNGAVIATATAAAVKCVDFLLPQLTPLAVVNPTAAILLEGLSFLVVAHALRLQRRARSFPVLACGVGAFLLLWRALFLMHSTIMNRLMAMHPQQHALAARGQFLLLDSLACFIAVCALLGATMHAHRLMGGWRVGERAQPPLALRRSMRGATAVHAAGLFTLALAVQVVSRWW